MSQQTKIEWCDSTLNLMMGCNGCELAGGRCYAERLVNRYAGRAGYPARFDRPKLFLDRLDAALRWKDLTGQERPGKPWLNGRPRMIFLNDLGDMFTEDLELDVWHEPIHRMAESPHVWLILTKRPRRLGEFVWRWKNHQGGQGFPRNFWCGTSITSEHTAGRIAELFSIDLDTVRFLSLEPLLGPICLKGPLGDYPLALVWLIVGGESGPGARPMYPESVRSIRDQCQAAGMPFFFKQWGDAKPDVLEVRAWERAGRDFGKKKGGRLLDDREWLEVPEVRR